MTTHCHYGWGNTNVDEANVEYELKTKLAHDPSSYQLFSGDMTETAEVVIKVPQIINSGQYQ